MKLIIIAMLNLEQDMQIPEEHKKLLTQTKKFIMITRYREIENRHEREKLAFDKTLFLYQEYGYAAIRYAAVNAVGYQSFVNHCKSKKRKDV